jgi:hypothetical protein
MRFHRTVRGSLRRLAAAVLIALLAWPVALPAWPFVARERPASAAHTDGMAATPARPVAAEVAIAPAGAAPTPASAVVSVVVCLRPLVSRTTTDRPFHLPVTVRPAPTVLRV